MMMRRRRRKGKAVTFRNTSTAKPDLIGRLPDAILTHILSFLHTKSAVATSILSKRWKDVWISVPNLDFFNCWWTHWAKGANVLKQNFIDRVLSLNNVSYVRKIYLYCGGFDDSRVNAWISSIARRDAEELELSLGDRIYSIPDFFHKEKLVKLNLQSVVLKVPPSVCFPNLKSLILFCVEFPDNDSMRNLLLGCPVLWSLAVELCGWMGNAQMLYVCSATLHKLDISNMCDDTDNFGIKFVIDAPNLCILNIQDFYEPSSYEIINVSSLSTATLHLKPDDDILIDVFADIAHVRDLSLHTRSSLIHTFPMFHNLVRFEIGFDIGWEVLPLMFHCMPKLVTLTVILDLSGTCDSSCASNEVPHCFLYCIENVKIRNLGKGGQEIQMIAYILKNAMALKNLVIGPASMFFYDKKKLLETLLNLPRSSSLVRFTELKSLGF